MTLEFTVSARIARPLHQVFEAVVDPAVLSGYFTTGGAVGRLETGATVTWDFADFPGAFPVQVVEVVADSRIILTWDANEGPPDPDQPGTSATAGYQTTVTMTFAALDDDRTLVTIHETGWRDTDGGQRASYGNCMGWSQMLCCMKAFLEHGLNLRDGMYV